MLFDEGFFPKNKNQIRAKPQNSPRRQSVDHSHHIPAPQYSKFRLVSPDTPWQRSQVEVAAEDMLGDIICLLAIRDSYLTELRR
jgi:hypothetical protein